MWLVGAAEAHELAGDVAIRAFVQDGVLAGAWTTSGLVQRDGAGVWRRVCHESYGDASDVWLEPDGTFWIATISGLVAATDGGCTQQLLVAEPVSRIWSHGGMRWVAVERDDGDGLLYGPAGGALDAAELPPEPVDIGGFGVSVDGSWWLAPSFDPSGLWTTADGGSTWAFVAGPELDALNVDVLGASPGGVAIAAWHEDGRSVVWEGPPWTRRVELPLTAESFACDRDTCRAGLGLALVEWDDAAVLSLVDGPPRAVGYEGGAWWGCEPHGAGGLVGMSLGDGPFASALERFDIVERACPAGSAGALACPAPPVVDAPAGDPLVLVPRSCGCGRAPGGAWWLVALVWRRRG